MGNSEIAVSFQQRVIHILHLFWRHVRDNQLKENEKLLDFLCQNRAGSDQRTIVIVDVALFLLAYLHDIDILSGTGFDFNETAPNLLTKRQELLAFQRRDNEGLNPLLPHSQCQNLRGEGLTGARGADNIDVGIDILLAVEEVDQNR